MPTFDHHLPANVLSVRFPKRGRSEQTSRSRAQAFADRAAFLLTIVAIAAAVVTLVSWSDGR